MRLYVEGRLKTTHASDHDLKNGLARLKEGTARDLELMDGQRKVSIKSQEGMFFMDVVDGNGLRYGMLIDAPRAHKSLRVFLGGELPMPEPVLPRLGPGVISIVIGDSTHPDCPVCKMLGEGD